MWRVLRTRARKQGTILTCLISDFYSCTTVSEKPHSTSRTAIVKTIGTVESVSTEAPGNTTGW